MKFDLEKALKGHPMVIMGVEYRFYFAQRRTDVGGYYNLMVYRNGNYCGYTKINASGTFMDPIPDGKGVNFTHGNIELEDTPQHTEFLKVICNKKPELTNCTFFAGDIYLAAAPNWHPETQVWCVYDDYGEAFLFGEGLFSLYSPCSGAVAAGKSVLEEAQELIFGQREKDYGSVTDNFSRIAVGWSEIFGCKVSPKQIGLAMVWLKIAQEVHSEKRDNLVDAAGYIGYIDKMNSESSKTE